MSVPRQTPASAAVPDGLPTPRRYWAIAVIILAIAMTVLDSTIVNVALPSIAREFAASPAASVWVVNAYQLAILALLLPLASLGEIVGYRRVSQAGVALFTAASLACALAPSLLTLSLARVLQGIGAAGIMGVSAALVRYTYPHSALGRAVGINALAVAIAAALGPTLAAGILAVADWRWLFGINVPVGLVTLAISVRALPVSDTSPRAFNLGGAALYAGSLTLSITGLQALAHDAVAPAALVQIVAGVLLGWLLLRHERSRSTPLVPFDLLARPIFALSLTTSVCSFVAQACAFIALPFEIQRFGYSPVATGLLMTPWPLALACAAPIAGRLADRHPAGILGGVGLLIFASGLALLAMYPPQGPPLGLLARMALCGAGFGLFQAPNNRTLLAAAPRARSGAAGGMLNTARLTGQTLGAASVALLFRASGLAGARLALCLACLLALAGAVASLARLKHVSPP
jgi:DHA2 family multidrug resistance protein-like MFS transporter